MSSDPGHLREGSARAELTREGALLVTYVDPQLAALLGRATEEIVGLDAWLKLLPAKDVSRCLRGIERLRAGRPTKDRMRVLDAKGEVLVLSVDARPVPTREQGMSVEISFRDVTEIARLETALQASEARLRLLDDNLGIGMWSTDEALRFTWSSGSVLGEDNSLVGASLYEFFSGTDGIEPIKAHHRALSGETTGYEVEWGERRLRALLRPLRDELGRISGVMAVAVDLESLMRAARARWPEAIARAHHQQLHPPSVPPPSDCLIIGDLIIDPRTYEVHRDGRAIELTVTEFKLLMEFALHPRQVLSKRDLAAKVWGNRSYGDTASVSMAISRLREKIEHDPAEPRLIETVRGVGYRSGKMGPPSSGAPELHP